MIGEIFVAHLVGDYLLQTHHQATGKLERWAPAVLHGVTYTVPFIFITQSFLALFVICSTHIVIDRYRLARHVVWFKNQFAPKEHRPGHTATGYPDETPAWLAVWLLIISDNVLHILINIGAVKWL